MNIFIKNYKSFFLLIFILLAVELIIINFPLLNSIGYEFSLVNGFILFIISAIVIKIIFSKYKFDSFLSFVLENRLIIITIFLIPLIIGSLSSILVSKCPLSLGYKFYFTIPFFSFFYGLFISYLSIKTFPKYFILTIISVTLIFLVLGFMEFYYYPQVYSFNPIYGFINGTIYDEEINLNNKIIFFQIFSIFVFALIYFSTELMLNKNLGKLKIYLMWVFIVLFSFTLKPFLGFATNKSSLERKLTNRIITEHFEISIDKNLTDSEKFNIGLMHEYYYEQICSKLKVKYKNKIHSFVFKNRNQKGELLGSSNAEIAKPWLNQLYISYESIDETLKHEIAHVIASNFGSTIFKVAANLNSALIEGLAMFVENDFDGYDVDFVADLYLKKNPKFNFQSLFSNSKFFSNYSTIAYVLSGSFLNFVSTKYGIEKVKEIYSTNDFQSSLNKNLDVLVSEYFLYINSKKYQYNKYKAQLYFSGKSLTMKYCPRDAAVDFKNANLSLKQKKYFESLKLYKKIYKFYKNYNSLNGLIKSMLMVGNYKKALAFLQNEIQKFNEDQNYFNLELLLSDCFLLNGNVYEAKIILNNLIQQNPNYNYSNEAKFRLFLIEHLGKKSFYYYQKNNQEKFEILSKLFSLDPNEKILLRLIYLSKQLKKDYYQFLNKVTIEENIDGFYTNLSLSKFYFWENNFELSKKYAVDAVKINVPEEEKYKAIENLRMINWFVNYQNEIKITMSKNEPK